MGILEIVIFSCIIIILAYITHKATIRTYDKKFNMIKDLLLDDIDYKMELKTSNFTETYRDYVKFVENFKQRHSDYVGELNDTVKKNICTQKDFAISEIKKVSNVEQFSDIIHKLIEEKTDKALLEKSLRVYILELYNNITSEEVDLKVIVEDILKNNIQTIVKEILIGEENDIYIIDYISIPFSSYNDQFNLKREYDNDVKIFDLKKGYNNSYKVGDKVNIKTFAKNSESVV